MANMDKARKRIQQFYEGEMRGVDPGIREALGRRLEVDARFRAIVNYLEELTFDVDRLTRVADLCACGEPIAGHPAGISEACGPMISPGLAGSVTSDLAEATPGDSLPVPSVGNHGRPGEVCGCDEAAGLRERLEALQTRLGECDEGDSAALHELRAVIDDRIGWDSQEQEEAGDYLARLHEVAVELPGLRKAAHELFIAHADVRQARDEKDKAALVVAAARRVISDSAPEAVAVLMKALSDYDLAEMPF